MRLKGHPMPEAQIACRGRRSVDGEITRVVATVNSQSWSVLIPGARVAQAGRLRQLESGWDQQHVRMDGAFAREPGLVMEAASVRPSASVVNKARVTYQATDAVETDSVSNGNGGTPSGVVRRGLGKLPTWELLQRRMPTTPFAAHHAAARCGLADGDALHPSEDGWACPIDRHSAKKCTRNIQSINPSDAFTRYSLVWRKRETHSTQSKLTS